jgi:hypothetical protein
MVTLGEAKIQDHMRTVIIKYTQQNSIPFIIMILFLGLLLGSHLNKIGNLTSENREWRGKYTQILTAPC